MTNPQELLELASVAVRDKVRLVFDADTMHLLGNGQSVMLKHGEAENAAGAALQAVTDAGYTLVPSTLVDDIRVQALADILRGQVSVEDLDRARGVEPVRDLAELSAGGPYTEAELLAFIATIQADGSECS